MIWPKDTREELDNFYGKHRLGADGMPTSAWESERLTRIILPYDESAGMMPKVVVKIFKAERWKWGGSFRSRPDCMHFQATS
ncbi:MAG: M15 family metallopeptidase [Blastocatellia bacterium]